MKLRNFTPHTINLCGISLPSEGVARVEMATEVWSHEDYLNTCIPFVKEVPVRVIGLPESETDTFFIVSRMVKDALPSNKNLACPTDFIRDDQGKNYRREGIAGIATMPAILHIKEN